MEKLIYASEHYKIRRLGKESLYELAEFVVRENYKHHVGCLSSEYMKDDSLLVDGVTQKIFKSFEEYLTPDKIHLWMYLMQLHHFLRKTEDDTYHEIIDDSKYYLSYPIGLDHTLSKKDKVLKLKIKF